MHRRFGHGEESGKWRVLKGQFCKWVEGWGGSGWRGSSFQEG